MAKIPTQEYLEKAKKLTKTDAERLFSRMGKKLGRWLDDNKLEALEALALQLEKEDDDLKEWRKQFAEIKNSYIQQIKSAKI
jgi:uncharacterized protein YpuA (DUF1002 family)